MKQKSSIKIFIAFNIIILIIGLLLAITLGATNIRIIDVWNSIFNYNDTIELITIRDVRIPRVLSVLFTGGILGASGAMIQGVTRNPIAEPSLLGVSQGATLVIAIFYAIGVTINTTNVMIASLVGSIFSGLIVIGFLV